MDHARRQKVIDDALTGAQVGSVVGVVLVGAIVLGMVAVALIAAFG